jgi:molybdopterin converting factor subunit 1
MKITLKTFAWLREQSGASEHTLDMPNDASLQEALTAFSARFPQLDLSVCRVALNHQYQRDFATILHENDELALIPPVSGG